MFIGWFERVYKAAPNAIEARAREGRPTDALIERARRGDERTASTSSRACSPAATIWSSAQLTAADFVAYPFLKYALDRDPADTELFHLILDDHQPLGDSHPNLRAWIERIGALPRAY